MKINIKIFIFFIFCITFVISCAERRVYIPNGKDSMPSVDTMKKDEKPVVEKPQAFEDETIAGVSQMEELIRQLQQEIKDIYFDYDKYDIRQDAIPTLKKVASIVQRYPKIRLIIEGHCDERGTNEYNFALGQRRANSAKQYLISLGVASSRIDIVSYGEEKPICTEQNEVCWQKNRRAHFVLIEEGK